MIPQLLVQMAPKWWGVILIRYLNYVAFSAANERMLLDDRPDQRGRVNE